MWKWLKVTTSFCPWDASILWMLLLLFMVCDIWEPCLPSLCPSPCCVSTGWPSWARHCYPAFPGALWEHAHDHLAGDCVCLQRPPYGTWEHSTSTPAICFPRPQYLQMWPFSLSLWHRTAVGLCVVRVGGRAGVLYQVQRELSMVFL